MKRIVISMIAAILLLLLYTASADEAVLEFDPEAAPQVLQAESFGYGGIRITWQGIPGAEGYYIYRDVGVGQSPYLGKVYTDASDDMLYTYVDQTAPEGRISYTFKAFSGQESSQASNKLGTDHVYGIPEGVIEHIEATAEGYPKLCMKEIPGATGYLVYRLNEEQQAILIGESAKPEYIDQQTEIGFGTLERYACAVRMPADGAEKVGIHGTVCPFVLLNSPEVSCEQITENSYSVSWNAISGADWYEICAWRDGFEQPQQPEETTSCQIILQGENGCGYHVIVRAMTRLPDFPESAPIAGIPSESVMFMLLVLQKTTITSIVPSGTDGAKLTWDEISVADGYYVYRSTSQEQYAYLGYSGKCEYTDVGLEPGVTYYYRVTARRQMDRITKGPLSDERPFTILVPPEVHYTYDLQSGYKLTWKPVTGASHYRVYVRSGADGEFSTPYETTGCTWTLETADELAASVVIRALNKNDAYEGFNILYGPLSDEITLQIPLDFTYVIEDGKVIVTGCPDETESLYIPSDIQGMPVISIRSGAFRQKQNLKYVSVSGSMTSIGEKAFYGCASLLMAELPDSIDTIGAYAFAGCTALNTVKLPWSLKTLGAYAFFNCSSIAHITLPGEIDRIGEYAFSMCTALETIQLPATVVELGKGAFLGCTALTGAELSSGLNEIQASTFYHCTSLQTVRMPAYLTRIGAYAFFDCRNLMIANWSDYLETIEDYAFSYCESLLRLNLPDSLSYVGDYAFYGCIGAAEVHIPAHLSYRGVSAFSVMPE